ncbi:MAG: purine-cytosine permease family protein [Alphaproteobacteria bacterium]
MKDQVGISRKESGFAVNEYEREPVPEDKTKGIGSFLGLFASEHVAATELLIGPLFVAHGVSAFDLLVGLLLGNFLAVMSWTFLTAPIAVKRRLTLYYQLEKIGGPRIIDVYNVANGILWCCLAAAFIYVSATALFVPLKLPVPQLTDWAPNSVGMVVVIMALGVVIAVVAAKGYDAVVRFANIAAPWMVVMFLVFGIAALPELGVRSLDDFWRVANEVWDGNAAKDQVQFTFWHVVCFAWFGNMAWHVGMGDLTIFRYARKARYGLASAAGMYLGHYVAWITAGLLFAVQLKHDPANTSVVPGPMAYRVAGVSGILLVLFAGWTTANPVLYRAGLAFQSVRPKWSRVRVTLVAGAVACVIAVFPGLCNKFLSVAMLYGLVLMPMGAVIFADHYLMKRLGMVEFYAERDGKRIHWPPMLAWILSLLICLALWYFVGIQEFFLCLPGWLLSGVIYMIASKLTQSPATPGEDL